MPVPEEGMLFMSARNPGLDLLRVLCCVGVLFYHVLDALLADPAAAFLYYAASFCVPGFFLLSGYLIGAKPQLTFAYCERKIVSTLQKLLLWHIVWGIVTLIYSGSVYDLWGNFLQGIVSAGVLPVSWFLFTYCALLIFAFPLHALLQRSLPWFAGLVVAWLAVLACGFGSTLHDTQTQSLWLHLYGGYFAMGMLLARLFPLIDRRLPSNCQILLSLVLFLFFSFCYFLQAKSQSRLPDAFYGRWYYTGWLFSLVWLLLKLPLSFAPLQNALQALAKNTFAVYLGHLPLLLYWEQISPLHSLPTALGVIALLFCFWQLSAEIFKRLPVLRLLV